MILFRITAEPSISISVTQHNIVERILPSGVERESLKNKNIHTN